LIALISALAALLFSLLLQCCSSFAWRWDFDSLLFWPRVGKVKFAAPFLQCSFDGCGEIEEQMNPIRYYNRCRLHSALGDHPRKSSNAPPTPKRYQWER